ncbi:MAG: hypothetical protein ABIQ97_01180, partial [Lysobacteraceae bacterium]
NFKLPRLLVERIFLWPILLAFYVELGLLVHSSVTKRASGFVSVGFLLALMIGVPTLVGYAGYFWRKNLLHGIARWEALACVAFPILLIAFGLLAFFSVMP